MSRQDLLTLSLVDLEALTNRGTIKRAQRDLEACAGQFEISEQPDGAIGVRWPDGVLCQFPAGQTVREGRCSCNTTGVCRHLVQSVLAYQQAAAATTLVTTAPQPWDPGGFSDAELEKLFTKAKLAAARARFSEDLLVELIRSSKPSARFEGDQCTLRFLVAGDLRYVHCDCAEPAPCTHVPLAVWAFRELPSGQTAGMFAPPSDSAAVPTALLQDLEDAMRACVETGFGQAPRAWRDRLVRLEAACRAAGLVWPADLVADLVQEWDHYQTHDARFSPAALVDLLGELLIRCDALRARTGAVPAVFIRGSGADRLTELGAARFIGLGCGVTPERKGVRLTAYLQDSESGSTVGIDRFVPDPPDAAPLSFHQLAGRPISGGVSLAMFGSGQVLVKGARRSPNRRLVLPRGKLTFNPQAYAWEKLREPVRVESCAELRAHLATLPPASLRPRRVTEGVHVLPVCSVTHVRFDHAAQQVQALVHDAAGEAARLQHPFLSRGAEGAEALLELLRTRPAAVRFLAAQVRLLPIGLVLSPIAVVSEEGGNRSLLQPWIETTPRNFVPMAGQAASCLADPISTFPEHLTQSLSELWLLGLQHVDTRTVRSVEELRRFAEEVGLVRLAAPVRELAACLEQRAQRLDWDWRSAAEVLLVLTALARLSADLAVKSGSRRAQAAPDD
jgi:hypothetical protein